MRNIVVLGSSGSIGKPLVELLKNENLFLADRSYKNVDNKIFLDLSDFQSVLNFIEQIKKIKIDYFFINSGLCTKTAYTKDNIEINFMVNAFSPYYILKEVMKEQANCRVILTSSLSVYKGKVELEPKKWKHLYRNTKYMEHMLIQYLSEQDHNNTYIFAHPGITKSSISYSLHNPFVRFWISYFGNSNEGAAEVLSSAMMFEGQKDCWVCPDGLFHLSGKPKVMHMKKTIVPEEEFIENVQKTEQQLVEKYRQG